MRVHPTTDQNQIRRLLNLDRVWSLYALADLDPHLFDLCQWWTTNHALALVFNGISIRPIFVMGPKQDVEHLLENLPVDEGYLNLRDEHTPQDFYQYQKPHRMRRMVMVEPNYQKGDPVALGPEHVEEIQGLYASGSGAGVAFAAFQLDTGFFQGVRNQNGELVAVAGVHVVSETEGVAGIGNVFTREDCRGMGFAQITTSAVVAALLETGIETIGLNVEHDNAAAIAAYEKLGFHTAFEYWEGTAVRKTR